MTEMTMGLHANLKICHSTAGLTKLTRDWQTSKCVSKQGWQDLKV